MLYPLGGNSSIIVKGNIFRNNTAYEFGGGCFIRSPGGDTEVEYRNNEIYKNSTQRAGSGGGTYIEVALGKIDFFNNIHRENTSIWRGGGVWIEMEEGEINIKNNTFTKNSAEETGGGMNLFIDRGTLTMDHNVINRNDSEESGGGVSLATTSGKLKIFNNTFYSNASGEGGDIYLYFDSTDATVDFYNNILYKSQDPSLSFSGAKNVVARYSDNIWWNW